jgi:hypothetical protein
MPNAVVNRRAIFWRSRGRLCDTQPAAENFFARVVVSFAKSPFPLHRVCSGTM